MTDNNAKNNYNQVKLQRIYQIYNGSVEIGSSTYNDPIILASDSAFMQFFLDVICSDIATIGGLRNGILTEVYLKEMRDVIALGADPVRINKVMLKIWSKDSSLTDKPLKWETTIGEDPLTVRYPHSLLKDYKFNIPAIRLLSFTPQTRILLGLTGVSFEDPQTGLITVPSKGTFNMSKEEMDKWSKKSNVTTYTGIDIVTSVAIGKVITNINDMKTISYSTHRANAQVRGCGSSYARGISRGPRTIAGSIVCTVRLMDPMRMLDPQTLLGYDEMIIESDADLFKETMMPDQYPLFDLLVFYQNELGDASALIIYGISISDSGQTSSVSDTETEMMYTYTAIDLDPIRMMRFDPNGVIINPFETNAYMRRKERIVSGLSLHNDPYAVPSVQTTIGNLSHLDFLL